MSGVSTLISHPELPTCQDCKDWIYDENWKRLRDRKTGKEYRRPLGTPTPCHKCPKGPVPFEKELTLQNAQAFRYYLECKVDNLGLLPQDRITVRNNSLIRFVEENATRQASVHAANSLATAIMAMMNRVK